MTRDEAVKLMVAALGTPANGAMLAEQQAYAGRLAAALDAIGILAYAANPYAPQQQDADADVHG